MNILFFTLPLYLPILIYMLMPKTAGKSLKKLNGCVMNYGKYIISVFSFIFGFWLLYDAIQFFLGQ